MGKYLIRENNKISHNILQERIKIGNKYKHNYLYKFHILSNKIKLYIYIYMNKIKTWKNIK